MRKVVLKKTTLQEVFGRTLRESRCKMKLSQERLALESGYHRTYISFLERGLKNPSLKTIFKLAQALGVSPSEIIQRVESRL